MSKRAAKRKIQSSLTRPLDPAYRTNLVIMILTVAAGIVTGITQLISAKPLLDAIIAATAVGACTFITWVVAREIDPDHDLSAFVGVGLMWIAIIIFPIPVPAIFPLAAMILYLRIVNRIVGPSAAIVDSAILLVIVIIAAALDQWIIGVAAAGAFLIDAFLPVALRRQLLFSLLVILVIAARIFFFGWGNSGELSLPWLVAILLAGLAFVLTMLATRTIRVGCDQPGYKPDVRRIRAAMALALGGALAVALWHGDQGVLQMLPAWSAMLGVVLFRIRVTVQEWYLFRQKVRSS